MYVGRSFCFADRHVKASSSGAVRFCSPSVKSIPVLGSMSSSCGQKPLPKQIEYES